MFHQLLILLAMSSAWGLVVKPSGVHMCSALLHMFNNCTCREFDRLNLQCSIKFDCQADLSKTGDCTMDTVNVQTRTKGRLLVPRTYHPREAKVGAVGRGENCSSVLFFGESCIPQDALVFIGDRGRMFVVNKAKYCSVQLGPLPYNNMVFTLRIRAGNRMRLLLTEQTSKKRFKMNVTMTLHLTERNSKKSFKMDVTITGGSLFFKSSSKDHGVIDKKSTTLRFPIRLTVGICSQQGEGMVYVNSEPPISMQLVNDKMTNLQISLSESTNIGTAVVIEMVDTASDVIDLINTFLNG